MFFCRTCAVGQQLHTVFLEGNALGPKICNYTHILNNAFSLEPVHPWFHFIFLTSKYKMRHRAEINNWKRHQQDKSVFHRILSWSRLRFVGSEMRVVFERTFTPKIVHVAQQYFLSPPTEKCKLKAGEKKFVVVLGEHMLNCSVS